MAVNFQATGRQFSHQTAQRESAGPASLSQPDAMRAGDGAWLVPAHLALGNVAGVPDALHPFDDGAR